MLDEVKQSLRVSTNAFDSEIQDLIDSARTDLEQAGVSSVKTNDEQDAYVKMAIKLYCKSHFGYANTEAERFIQSYEGFKQRLRLSVDYQQIEP